MNTPSCSTQSKTCTVCGQVKLLESFGRHAQGLLGRRSLCRRCVAEHGRAYRATERGRAVHRLSRARFEATPRGRAWRRAKMLRHRQRHPEKELARSAVSQAIKRGRLIPPLRCSHCGQESKTEAHHHAGYAPENWLNVRWLCRKCHHMFDGQVPREAGIGALLSEAHTHAS